MVAVVLRDGLDADGTLRPDRARDGRNRQHQQQHQRGTHAGEPAPERACRSHMATDPGPTVTLSQVRNWAQTPVASARPTSTSIAPPTRVTHTLCRRIAWRRP